MLFKTVVIALVATCSAFAPMVHGSAVRAPTSRSAVATMKWPWEKEPPPPPVKKKGGIFAFLSAPEGYDGYDGSKGNARSAADQYQMAKRAGKLDIANGAAAYDSRSFKAKKVQKSKTINRADPSTW